MQSLSPLNFDYSFSTDDSLMSDFGVYNFDNLFASSRAEDTIHKSTTTSTVPSNLLTNPMEDVNTPVLPNPMNQNGCTSSIQITPPLSDELPFPIIDLDDDEYWAMPTREAYVQSLISAAGQIYLVDGRKRLPDEAEVSVGMDQVELESIMTTPPLTDGTIGTDTDDSTEPPAASRQQLFDTKAAAPGLKKLATTSKLNKGKGKAREKQPRLASKPGLEKSLATGSTKLCFQRQRAQAGLKTRAGGRSEDDCWDDDEYLDSDNDYNYLDGDYTPLQSNSARSRGRGGYMLPHLTEEEDISSKTAQRRQKKTRRSVNPKTSRKPVQPTDDNRKRKFSFKRAEGAAKLRNSEALESDKTVELYVGRDWEQLVGTHLRGIGEAPSGFIFADNPLSGLLYLSCLELGLSGDQLVQPIGNACPICGNPKAGGTSINHLRRHVTTHLRGLGYKWKCPVDANMTHRYDNVERHLSKCPGYKSIGEPMEGHYLDNLRLIVHRDVPEVMNIYREQVARIRETNFLTPRDDCWAVLPDTIKKNITKRNESKKSKSNHKIPGLSSCD